MKLLGSISAIGAAFVVAYITAGLTGPCGGYAECGMSSSVVVASAFAWLGLAGVVIAVVAALRGFRRATALVLLLTGMAYVGWVAALIREYGG